MRRIFRVLLCVLAPSVLVGVTTSVAAPARHVAKAATARHPIIGIGDDKDDLFGDPKFLALGIHYVRYDMPYDAMSVRSERAAVTRWMDLAHERHQTVLVTIDHSDRVIWKWEKVHGHRKHVAIHQSRVLPSESAYVKAVKAFRARFPWVTEFATWDETNYFGEATFNRVSRVVQYYKGLRAACPKCTILAAEFLDVNTHLAIPMTRWAHEFIKDLGYQPGYWGLNNYEDVNHLQDIRTRQLLAAVKGDVWLAETGGIVSRHNGTKDPGFPQNAAHAALADRYLLDTIGSLSPRIQRIYLYEWDAHSPHDGWDTALVSWNQTIREGYVVLADTLHDWGIRPDCAISRIPPTCTGLGGGGTFRSTGATGASGSTGATGSTGTTGSTGAVPAN